MYHILEDSIPLHVARREHGFRTILRMNGDYVLNNVFQTI
jgi:hypothetical protein